MFITQLQKQDPTQNVTEKKACNNLLKLRNIKMNAYHHKLLGPTGPRANPSVIINNQLSQDTIHKEIFQATNLVIDSRPFGGRQAKDRASLSYH